MSIHFTWIQLSFYYTVLNLHHGRICEATFGRTFRCTVKTELSSGKNWREAVWESALRCELHSGIYTSFLIRQCLNTVPVKLKKWHFAANWKLWRKVKYPEIKPRKNDSMKLHSDVCVHVRKYTFTICCPIWKLCLWKICEGILSGAQSVVVRKEMSFDEYWTESFGITAL